MLKGDAWRITNKADIVPRCVWCHRTCNSTGDCRVLFGKLP
jgi:hypothetical protein